MLPGQSQGDDERVQDGTLVVNKSQSRFVTSASDWKLFSKDVPKKLQQFYDDGYKIVVFRQGLMSVTNVSDMHVLPLLHTSSMPHMHPLRHELIIHCLSSTVMKFKEVNACSNQNGIGAQLDGKMSVKLRERAEQAFGAVSLQELTCYPMQAMRS